MQPCYVPVKFLVTVQQGCLQDRLPKPMKWLCNLDIYNIEILIEQRLKLQPTAVVISLQPNSTPGHFKLEFAHDTDFN